MTFSRNHSVFLWLALFVTNLQKERSNFSALCEIISSRASPQGSVLQRRRDEPNGSPLREHQTFFGDNKNTSFGTWSEEIVVFCSSSDIKSSHKKKETSLSSTKGWAHLQRQICQQNHPVPKKPILTPRTDDGTCLVASSVGDTKLQFWWEFQLESFFLMKVTLPETNSKQKHLKANGLDFRIFLLGHGLFSGANC